MYKQSDSDVRWLVEKRINVYNLTNKICVFDTNCIIFIFAQSQFKYTICFNVISYCHRLLFQFLYYLIDYFSLQHHK